MAGTLSDNGFRDDLLFAFDTVAKVHPRPYYRTSQAELEACREMCLVKIGHCTNVADFWRIAQSYFAMMADAHTGLQIPVSTGVVKAPLETELIGGEVVVTDVLLPDECTDIKRGDRVVAVGLEDVEQRLRTAYHDRPTNTERYGRRRAARDILLFIGSEPTITPLLLSRPDGTLYERSIPLLPLSAQVHREAEIAQRRRLAMHAVRSQYHGHASVPCLSYVSCVDRAVADDRELKFLGLEAEEVPDMEEECWSFFGRLSAAGAHSFVLDLRGNGGGNSTVGEHLLKYLTREPVQTYGGGTLTYPYRSRLEDERLAALSPFQGQMFVLINADVFSSGEWLAAQLRANGLGTFLGEPTGGGGAVPGNQQSYQLPRTGLILRVSTAFFIPPGGPDVEMRGVYPDYWVTGNLQSYLDGTDPVLDYACNLAQGKKNA